MPSFSKREKLLERMATERSNDHFETGVYYHALNTTTTGECVWRLFDEQSKNDMKETEIVADDCRDTDLSIGQTVSITHQGCEMSANVLNNVPFCSNVELCLHDGANTIITANKLDLKVLVDEQLQITEDKPSSMNVDEEVDNLSQQTNCSSLVIDIPNGTSVTSQDYEDTEEVMAAAVLTSLSLSPVLSKFEVPYDDTDAFEDGVCNPDDVTPPPAIWAKENINRRTKTRRRKNSFKTVFQCTWPGCGKILTNYSGITRHVRTSHLGPKKDGDNGFSDGEEEFYFNEIEQNTDENGRHLSEGSISPPLPHFTTRRCRSMSDPSPPTQPLLSSMSTQLHVDDNFIWPLRSTAGNRSKTKRPLHQTVHTSSRKGRGDGRKCRKVFGMENRNLWCTQCRWKKACIKFVD